MFDIEKTLSEYGLTPERYEELLKDCSDKVGKTSIYDWDEILLNYNIDFAPDTGRKAQQPPLLGGAFIKQYYEEKMAKSSTSMDEDKYLKKLQEMKREIERSKIQFRDERRSWSKQNYTDARFDEILDGLEDRLKDFGKTNFLISNSQDLHGDKSMIICLSDLHLGQCFDSFAGEFNSSLAKERLNKYLNEILDIAKANSIGKAYIFLLGDNISNSLHKTIEVSNKENVIDQLKLAIEYISSFCNELTNHFDRVFLASASGNHSRLQAKDLSQHGERLDAFIAWDVCRTLEHKPNFTSLLHRSIDDGISDVDIDGVFYTLVHGDFDSNTKQGYLNLSNMLGYFPSYVFMGHRHYCMYSQDSHIIQSGSLASSGDDYCIEKRLSGKASQMVCICDKTGIKSLHPVILN